MGVYIYIYVFATTVLIIYNNIYIIIIMFVVFILANFSGFFLKKVDLVGINFSGY